MATRGMLLALVLIVVLICPADGGWWRRRRRSGCRAVHCVWGGWSAWSACTDPCGSAGTQTRSRAKATAEACGGKACAGESTDSKACNRFCNHGGTPLPGHCSCPDEYWGTCCEHPCTVIVDCQQLTCNSGTNQQCRRCNYNYGLKTKAYRLASKDGHDNRICEKICSWRSDSSYCYPGKCPDTPSSCQCAPGFESASTNCMTISAKPSIAYCHVTLKGTRGASKETVEVTCQGKTNPVVYTNVHVTTATIEFKSTFKGPSTSEYPLKYYISAFKVGITQAQFHHSLARGSDTVVDCSSSSSVDKPNSDLHVCTRQVTLQNTPSRHADRLSFKAVTKNGGYVKINNYDGGATPTVGPSKYYSGQTTTHSAILVIDLVKPVHCSVGSTCSDKMLDRGQPFTKSASLTVRWAGWSDALADIKLYEVEIYKMALYGDKLAHHGEAPVVRKSLSASSKSFSTTLVDPGVYTVLLAVEDKAGNAQVARRFLIFDNKNVVTINMDTDKQMRVTSAAKNTSYTWVTSLQDTNNAGEQVSVAWNGHFANVFQHTKKFLNGIAANSPPLETGYEERTGQPPDTLSMEAIPNVNAIVKYELSRADDHEGGRSLTAPTSWVNVKDFKSETMKIDVPRADGDSVRVWLRATDVMGNTKTDSVLVHVDSSPSVIQDVWLSRHGRTQLAVHHSVDLFDAKFEFDSHDFHSGLREIHWRLHDLANPASLHGSGQIAVRRHSGAMTDCVAPNCYCIPKDNECFLRHFEINPDMSKMVKPRGDHDFDYQLVLNVTNNAMLSSIFIFKITVDTTAPLPGVVSDSEQSEPDVDFQQSSTQHASWQGFFDRESGILFYQYAFSDGCLTASDFSVPATGKVTKTTLTYASRTVSGPGTYHCTVVAYNKALEPSEPVCSDGVTVDKTAPEIHEVSIENSWTKDGLVNDSTGHVWYIDRNRFRVLLDHPSDSCRRTARLANNLAMYRIRQLRNTSGEDSKSLCAKPTFQTTEKIIISKENVLELSWFGSDGESGIHTYEVGLSSTGSEDMNLLSYTSTHGHHHFITYHPDLMDGETFYIHIKAVNRAGKQIVQVLGPATVQVKAPTFSGDVALSLRNHGGTLYLVGRWPRSSFSTGGLQGGFIYGLSYSVGHSPGTSNVKDFAPLSQESNVAGLCTWTEPPTCVATPVGRLQWRLHGRHTYYLNLKLEGINGHDRLAPSNGYEHYIGAPSGGIVVEIPTDTDQLRSEDIDHQASGSQLHVTWYGFQHIDQPISYELAVGTKPGIDDVIGFMDVGGSNKSLTGLTLRPFTTYYASVRASTPDGSTTVSSDGVTILPADTPIEGATILDALPCVSAGSRAHLVTSHHTSPLPEKSCDVDVDFQSSISHMGIKWSLPAEVTTLVTNVKWGIQEHGNGNWTSFREMTDAGRVSHVIATDLHLEAGHKYRAVVQFCHPGGCFLPLHSDGVTITPDGPMSSGFLSASLNATNLIFTWSKFKDIAMTSSAAGVVSRHEWTLLVKHSDGQSSEHLYPWREVTGEHFHCGDTSNELCSYSVRLTAPLETSSCVVVALRAYNKVGLYSTITRQLRGCDVISKVKLTVLDAVATTINGGIFLEKNAQWHVRDREYTPFSSTLSAVWPDLRHGTYLWKIVSDDAIRRFAYVQPETVPDYADYNCAAPEVVACGETQDNFVNMHGLRLSEGQRYHICILANATDLKFEKFTQHLEQNSECSNGIVVDTTPPIAGQVWVGGRQKHWSFQIDRSQLDIYWSSFVDVEKYGHSSHHSGILKYEYAVGTSPEGVDVQDYVQVGVTNMAVATGLTLLEGRTYYVTVRATDHVGKSTTAHSPGITVDATAPGVTGVPIGVGGSYVTQRTELSAAWKGVFNDAESGIDRYYWCVGSRSAYCDVMPYVEAMEPAASTTDDLRLTDGHTVYVSVQAVNRVGLTAVATSSALIVDTSVPVAGHVYDVVNDVTTKDVDYTTDASTISAAWAGFHDPHSHITGYSVKVGKCPGCEDILQKSHVGITTSLHISAVTLELGVTYYTTVEACNGAGLCVTVTSDGIIVDTSPPVAGVIFDGISIDDRDWQSSRLTLSAHWVNFHDPESDLLNMEWRAGTSPGYGDILRPTRLDVTDKATTTLTKPMPMGKRLYVTLKVFNKAGLSTETSSDGFIVDDTAPVSSTRIAVNSHLGSLNKNTQVWKSSLSVQWNLTDPESSVVEQFVSLTTRDSIQHNVPAVKLYGDVQEYTFNNVSLADGEIYYAKVIACNGARLCTTSVSEGILVDGTPPTAGAFAVHTEHAADLTRHRSGWMTYDQKILRLAWLGFSDAHCDVTTYYVNVGTTFGASDLLPGGETLEVTHTTDDPHADEGFVQKAQVSLASTVQHNQQLYISLWAINKVGLVSSRLHGTFTAMPSQLAAGTLALVRRCQPVTCEGHCTCAPHGQGTCKSTATCRNVTGKPGYQQVSVYDIDDYSVTPESNTQDVDFTRSQCALAATWRAVGPPGKAPVRYEWSVGVEQEPIGHHLLDVLHEPTWRETGVSNMAVFTTGSSHKSGLILQRHVKYVTYVRAWYDADAYAVYVTDGLETDSSPPSLSRAMKVIDLESDTSTRDTDFVTSTSDVSMSWRDVFRDTQAGIQGYVVSVSKTLGGSDTAVTQLASTVTRTTFDGLTLDANDVYYVTVAAFNDAGLVRAAYSDGFKVDVTPPVAGQVWDGRGLTDQDYSRDNRTVAAWWRGFSDDQSYIDHYEWCVGTGPRKQDVVTCHNVGLHTRSTSQMSSDQAAGTRLYSTVYAVNGAGLKSAAVSSDGVVLDSTPPRPLHKFQLGANLLKNPSFEEDRPSSDLMDAVPKDWTVDGTCHLAVSRPTDGVNAQDGRVYVDVIGGHIEQAVTTEKTKKYRVTFYVHSPNTVRFHSQQLGFVQLPGFHAAFVVEPTVATSEWQKHLYYFIASDATSIVRVGAVGHKTGFLLDNVHIQKVGEGRRSPSTDPRDPVSSHVQPMHVHVTSRGSYTAVTAAWDVEDPESPVTSYSWAIGTVRGGVQLQNFRSVGGHSVAHTADLRLQHGTEVHVTVVAENTAGVTTVIHSDPLTIDLTAPIMCCLNDGANGVDTSYLTSRTLEITWSVKDPESGVNYCEWAIGKSPGSQEVQPFTRTTSLSTASVTLDAAVSHGETFFSVVRCFNYAGLLSALVSSGVVIATESPDVSTATVNIITVSPSRYLSRNNHQSDMEHLFFGWEGVHDRSGIVGYEISIQGSQSTKVLPWKSLATANQLFAELTDLSLESYKTYTLMLRATNYAHLTSDVIASNFTIETEAPRVTKTGLQSAWPSRWILSLDWTGVFTSNSSLLYEVNIGSTRGGIDIVSGRETQQTTLRVTGVDHTKEHHVTLIAFNEAGLYTTRTYVISYTPGG